MSDQPTAGVVTTATPGFLKLTGEWTPERVKKLLCCSWDAQWWITVADAHNAALAAEREYAEARRNEIYEAWKRELADEREAIRYWKEQWVERGAQLTAEREKVKMANTQCKTIAALMQDAEQQLAAEKQQAESMLATSKRVNDQLRKQLAAVKEGK